MPKVELQPTGLVIQALLTKVPYDSHRDFTPISLVVINAEMVKMLSGSSFEAPLGSGAGSAGELAGGLTAHLRSESERSGGWSKPLE